MERFLDTSNLVTYQSGKYKGKYDWSNNIGRELYFEYDGLTGYIKIINYEKSIPQGKITLQYKDNIMTTITQSLLHLKMPTLLGMEKQSNLYKHRVGDLIHKLNDSMEVLQQKRITYKNADCRGYRMKCKKCGYEYDTREDIFSTCPICGKRTSYPERYIFSLLIQFKIEFVPQKEFTWLPNRWYDIYLPDYNAIIEVHGKQHYTPTKINEHETPEEVYARNLKNDKLKRQYATNNGLKYYIINASKRKNLYIEAKKHLDFVDFSSVNELECEKFANYNYIINECSLWNSGLSLQEISDSIQKSVATVQSKLRLGDKYGLCEYSKKKNMKYHKVKNPNTLDF